MKNKILISILAFVTTLAVITAIIMLMTPHPKLKDVLDYTSQTEICKRVVDNSNGEIVSAKMKVIGNDIVEYDNTLKSGVENFTDAEAIEDYLMSDEVRGKLQNTFAKDSKAIGVKELTIRYVYYTNQGEEFARCDIPLVF